MKNIVGVLFIVVFLVEIYFCAAGSAHRRTRRLKGWNPVKGKIKSMEKVKDPISRRDYMELTIETESGSTVYAKQSNMFCIFTKGEEVELIEKDGVHRFIGNERVHKQGVKETLIGTIPFLTLVAIAALLSLAAHVW